MPSLYDKLGVPKSAAKDEIKKAYYKLSKTEHPDKGGDPDKFKEISHAYDILGDEEKRQMYDMTGDEGGGGDMGGGMPPGMAEMFGGGGGGMPFGFGGLGGLGAMFGEMFGGGGPRGGRGGSRRAPRGPDKVQDVPLTLADFYNGRTIPINFHQQRACGLCKAAGYLKAEPCSGCKGMGQKMFMRQIGPGMIQQGMMPCKECNGDGKRIIQMCHECNGKKYRTGDKSLSAVIEPGMAENEKIRFAGECSDSPDYDAPGDVVLNLVRAASEAESDFDWRGNDLHITHSVEMSEALLGFNAALKGHPSGKEVRLHWGGGPLQHQTVLKAKGMGMPLRGARGVFGDLFVHIDITITSKEMNAGWTDEQRAALRLAFPDWEPNANEGIPLRFMSGTD